jgi:hypothetical protein
VLAQDDEGIKIYDRAFKQTEPFVTAGDKIYLRSEIDRAVAAAEKTGDPNIRVKPVIPMEAANDLKSGLVTKEAFDKAFGPGSAAKILGTGGQTATPSGNFQGQ